MGPGVQVLQPDFSDFRPRSNARSNVWHHQLLAKLMFAFGFHRGYSTEDVLYITYYMLLFSYRSLPVCWCCVLRLGKGLGLCRGLC